MNEWTELYRKKIRKPASDFQKGGNTNGNNKTSLHAKLKIRAAAATKNFI